MKAQMRFQKYICLAMLIIGALATLYAFFYCSFSLSELGYMLDNRGRSIMRRYIADGKNDATLYTDIQGFNDVLMYCGIVMILLAVGLFITACSKRRNYYISNYVATGLCAGGNIVMSIVLLVMNGIWRAEFLNIDFDGWQRYWVDRLEEEPNDIVHFSNSTAMFDIGFVVYILVILASVLLILNLVWKIKLMQGEKKLLAGSQSTEVQAV